MPFTTWIRDLLGIRKDYVDTEKSVLEIEKLEADKRERELLTPATLGRRQEVRSKNKRASGNASEAPPLAQNFPACYPAFD